MQRNKPCLNAVAAAMLAALAAPAAADPGGAAPPLEDASARTAEVMRAAGLPGELVVTDVAGAERSFAFGLADREARTPNRIGQPWIWASVTKQVTATLVMQEVDRGRISLDAPVGKYLPGFGGNRDITIRELLQHRSGLPNPSADAASGFYTQSGEQITDRGRTAGFCAGPTAKANGGDWEYNNCDYMVLGAVLEAVTGLGYDALVEERLVRPLGLDGPHLAVDGAAWGGAAARGYGASGRVAEINVATGGAAAALIGTARDLARLDRAWMGGGLLSAEARDTAWKGDPALGYMALGVWSYPAGLNGCAAPLHLVERRGDFGGTQVRNVIAPSLGRAMVLFTNDASAEFGEVWQAKGLTYDLLSAAFCPDPANLRED